MYRPSLPADSGWNRSLKDIGARVRARLVPSGVAADVAVARQQRHPAQAAPSTQLCTLPLCLPAADIAVNVLFTVEMVLMMVAAGGPLEYLRWATWVAEAPAARNIASHAAM